MKQVNPQNLTIKQLREASGYLVEVDNAHGWYYQYPFTPLEGDIEYITVCLN